MQEDRSAPVARLAGSVRGLGVCDAMRVELSAGQRADFDATLDTCMAVAGQDVPALKRIRASLPANAGAPFVLCGPTGLVLELVAAALGAAVERVRDELREHPRVPVRTAALDTAAAWIATALDCRAVEAYCFEPPAG